MDFSSLLDAMTEQGGIWSAVVGDDWLQGRSLFGGLQAAIGLKAMRALVAPEVPLRTLQVTFVGPVPAGTVTARANVLRRGKSATHVEARVGNEQETQCLLLGVFGAARDSSVRILPSAPRVPTGKPIEIPPGFEPSFHRHLGVRWLSGSPPFTGNPVTRHVIEVDMRDRGPFGEAHLLVVADVPPPVALSMLKKPSPGSSMTWTMELFADDLPQQRLRDWRLDVEVTAARDGYTSQSVMVWAPDGTLAAISRQSMVIFG